MTPTSSDQDEPPATGAVLGRCQSDAPPGQQQRTAVALATSGGSGAAAATTNLGAAAAAATVSPLERSDPPAIAATTTGTSAGAALTRSLLLFFGFMFRRPSKLFRPNRCLRQLAESADQNLSPAFVRGIFKLKGGPIVVAATLLPPLLVNTTLGFLLFSSHSLISLGLARLPYFQRKAAPTPDTPPPDLLDELISSDLLGGLDGDYGETTGKESPGEEEITLETIIRGPRAIPAHPTLLSAIAGAGAGVIQGMAFTPIENVVRFFQQSAASTTAMIARFLHLPTPVLAAGLAQGPVPATPLEALRTLVASSSWNKSHSWWTGWRWAVARDAVSYSVFFATFDVTRRVGLRVKASCIQHHSAEPIPSVADAAATPPAQTPLQARLAQAGCIVAGGIVAATAAEAAGRPFRQASRLATVAAKESDRLLLQGKSMSEIPYRWKHPIRAALKLRGPGFFFHSSLVIHEEKGSTALKVLKRFGWRVVSVTPWGLGFLVFAYIGGEV